MSAKERPILMSGPLVVKTLAGEKTQTRRVMRVSRDIATGGTLDTTRFSLGRGRCFVLEPSGWPRDIVKWSPYGVPGDRLWVRETWGVGTRPDPAEGWVEGLEYRADVPALADERAALPVRRVEGVSLANYEGKGWIPSIHMPRWASRLTLEIVEVRVQRLNDISEEDARAEGVTVDNHDLGDASAKYRSAFRRLWDSINGKRLVGGSPVTWAANPFVWAITYKVVRP